MKVLPAIFNQLRQKEVISVVEFEFVRFLLQLDENAEQDFLLIVAACVHAQLNGNVCLDISQLKDEYLFSNPESYIKVTSSQQESFLGLLKQSSLVSTNGSLKPLVLEDERLYLHRFWKYENELADWIRSKSKKVDIPEASVIATIQNLINQPNSEEVNWQHVALCLSFMKDLVVISGGPGTGKTYTVLNIIAAHAQNKSKEFKVALAAPTGKAARRLTDSISSGKENLPSILKEALDIRDTALTVHKLLGSDFQGVNFKYNEQNKLPYDLIVIDEASMLDITMWVRLVRAIHDHTKLIVLGDKDQLASVEAGSILGDICGGENAFSKDVANSIKEITGMEIPKTGEFPAINDSVVFLTKSYRFDENSGIQKLADAINNSDAEKAISLLENAEYPDLTLLEPTTENLHAVIREFAVDHFFSYQQQKQEERLGASSQKKILCALRKGPFGVEYLNAVAEQKIRREIPNTNQSEWYAGRIIMATRNDGILKIRNGEIGLCEEGDDYVVKFEGDNNLPISAGRLQDYEPAYAITIHKSQGSEFNEVAIVLPSEVNSITSKEILYTSVTRARRNALVIGNKKIIRQTIQSSIARSSGLRNKIWQV